MRLNNAFGVNERRTIEFKWRDPDWFNYVSGYMKTVKVFKK